MRLSYPSLLIGEKKEAPIWSDERFLFNLEIIRVAAYALLEAGVDATAVLAAPQNEFLVAPVAPDRHFVPNGQRFIPPLPDIPKPSIDGSVKI